jgi:F-type H+-transporting ATPase subunit delta
VKDAVIARNYAEALLALAERHQAVERWGTLLDAVAGAVTAEPRILAVMMSPRVTKAAKRRLLEAALEGVAPAPFVRFLDAVVQRGRQGLLAEMSEAYQDAADLHMNRVHAHVTTARPVDPELARAIVEGLTRAVGRAVVARFREDPGIVGGVVVRVGDRAFDGSIRRRIQTLRARLLRAHGGGSGL